MIKRKPRRCRDQADVYGAPIRCVLLDTDEHRVTTDTYGQRVHVEHIGSAGQRWTTSYPAQDDDTSDDTKARRAALERVAATLRAEAELADGVLIPTTVTTSLYRDGTSVEVVRAGGQPGPRYSDRWPVPTLKEIR